MNVYLTYVICRKITYVKEEIIRKVENESILMNEYKLEFLFLRIK